jgi:3-hydroxyacyl-CoA dehydrogenase
MGSVIAEVCARAVLEVLIPERDEAALENERHRILASLDAARAAGKINADVFAKATSKFGFSTRNGDFARSGLDTVAAAAESLDAELCEPHLAPPPLLSRMVAAGRLGRKSGLGFYACAK